MPTLNVSANAPPDSSRPPIILLHGAANSAIVWTYWQKELAAARWPSVAIDLRGHGKGDQTDLAGVGMDDYVAGVVSATQQAAGRPVLMGWSMGGLVALMAASTVKAVACVCLAPSAPALARDPSVPIRPGVFGPEAYGITSRDPDAQPMMADLDREERLVALESLGNESQYARDERRAGIVLQAIDCPLLIVTGTGDSQWPRSRYDGLGLPAEFLEVAGASHRGLVLSKQALKQAVPAVIRWLEAKAPTA